MYKRNLKIALSVDGGGIRGVLPLAALNYLNQSLIKRGAGKGLVDYIDFITGTSTGAIISACIMVEKDGNRPFSIEEILSLYKTYGVQLFSPTEPDNPKGLGELLKQLLEGVQLKDLTSDYSLISFDKNENKPFVFESLNGDLKDTPLSLALTACSAIPGYFAPVEFRGKKLIDGIAVAKNPTKIGYRTLKELYPEDKVLLISLGTGQLTDGFFDEMEAEANRIDSFMDQESETNKDLIYVRFQPKLIKASQKMDDASPENVEALLEDSLSYLAKNDDVIEKIVDLILENSSID